MTQSAQETQSAPTGPVETAREQATKVGQQAAEKGSELTQTATDQAKHVTAEAGRQARDLMGEARGQLGEQATAQQQKVAQGLRSLVDELTAMAENSGQKGPATELANQAADKTRQVASWLEERRPGDLLNEVRRMGRDHPGAFLLAAAAAGVVAGRLTRGAVDSTSSMSAQSTGMPAPRQDLPAQHSTAPGPVAPRHSATAPVSEGQVWQ